MPDYRETPLAGMTWQRCHQIVIENPRGAPPSVRFDEERIFLPDTGAEVRTPAGSIAMTYDPTRMIPLVHPGTGEPLGECSYEYAYVIMYSAYLAEALARDVALAEAAIAQER